MQAVPLPPILLGVDQMSDETSLPKGAVRAAVNVEFNRAGGFRRRAGYTRIVSGLGFHSVFAAHQNQVMYGMKVNSLVQIDPVAATATSLYTMPTDEPVEWSEHNGHVFFSSRASAGWIPAGATIPRPLGAQVPSTPTLSASSAGSLLAGTYMTALSVVDERGEESGLSPWAQIKLTQQGGLVFSDLPIITGYTMRVWCSGRDGDVLYLAAEFPAGLLQYLLGSFIPKTPADHDNVKTLVPGEFCRAYGARLYTAQGDTLSFSLPYKFGRQRRATGYVQMNGGITFIEPVSTGIYVGAGTRVWWLEGTDPSVATQRMVSTCKAVPHSSVLVPGEHFPEKRIGTSDPVAVWLSTSGYTVGTPQGSVVELQADRVKVSPTILNGRTAFAIRDGVRQLITTTASSRAAAGIAVDSVTI